MAFSLALMLKCHFRGHQTPTRPFELAWDFYQLKIRSRVHGAYALPRTRINTYIIDSALSTLAGIVCPLPPLSNVVRSRDQCCAK